MYVNMTIKHRSLAQLNQLAKHLIEYLDNYQIFYPDDLIEFRTLVGDTGAFQVMIRYNDDHDNVQVITTVDNFTGELTRYVQEYHL